MELEKIKKNNSDYDLVVLTRGGGSFQDLFGFSQPELIETIYNFNLPIISAIGHQIDNPLSDLVCDFSSPTPSLAAQFIINHNKEYVKKLQETRDNLKYKLSKYFMNYLENLNKLNEKMNKKFNDFQYKQKNEIVFQLQNMLRKLDSLESRLNTFNSNNIILNGNGKIIASSDDLSNYIVNNKTMEIIWNGVIVKVKILQNN
jgi:exodeoxyribonuclease VII large subunit